MTSKGKWTLGGLALALAGLTFLWIMNPGDEKSPEPTSDGTPKTRDTFKYPRPLKTRDAGQKGARPKVEASSDLTALTRHAQEKWAEGLTRGQVMLYLGIPRYAVRSTDQEIDWASSIPAGGYELIWDNGNLCSPIQVQFDAEGKSVSASLGELCEAETTSRMKEEWKEPYMEQASCAQTSRRELCF